jgi:hypothetical protein
LPVDARAEFAGLIVVYSKGNNVGVIWYANCFLLDPAVIEFGQEIGTAIEG